MLMLGGVISGARTGDRVGQDPNLDDGLSSRCHSLSLYAFIQYFFILSDQYSLLIFTDKARMGKAE